MKSRKAILLPKEEKVLAQLGENIKLARLRRKITMEQVAERANIARSTLWYIEKGEARIGIGMYLRVLSVLGLAKDLLLVAGDDLLGRKLQDAKLLSKKRAPKRKKTSG
ncbi:MAG: helix-turn-helix transcriptional regulator [Bacteroidota bacterium]